MAKLVFDNGYISVNGVDLSNDAQSIEVNLSRGDEDATSMGAAGRQRLPGLKDESIVANWRQDMAAAQVDATLQPLYANGTAHTVEVRAVNAAVSATNPKYSGTCYLLEYAPIAGEVGSVLDASSTFVVDGALTRATA